MRFHILAAVFPLVSTYELHVPTPNDEVVVVASTTNEHTPDADQSIYSAPPLIKPGECTKPAVRREWRTLSNGDKKAWIDALKCVGNLPHSDSLYKTRLSGGIPLINETSSHYDDWTYAHIDTYTKSQVTALFFPWHRWYLDAFERVMKTRCNFNGTMPYWNWSLDVADLSKSPIFDPDPVYGLGTWGTVSNDWFVTDGAFNETIRAYPVPHTIRRQWTPQPFEENVLFPFEYSNKKAWANETATHVKIQAIIDGNRGDSDMFFAAIEGAREQGVRNAIQLAVGGDLADPTPNPADPLFWLHHAMLDRVFAMWQAKYPENAESYSGGSMQSLTQVDEWPTGLPPMVNTHSLLPVSGLEEHDVAVEQVMSVTSNYKNKWTGFAGGRLCYTYDNMLYA
ncbi:unnamed protein product [Rhizoctonia solani]|uniref:Tyrosinase copper-binding domain-containing protein n=1 Tax=Rhizoctonia solani TaxID=456999 RepID=A0A8H3GJI1_9AGAM|nr:unnamed protein product [Rhizoctonia solani]